MYLTLTGTIMNHYALFKSLHKQDAPLLLGNAWNVSSARVLEDNGITAIGTSSSAIADTLGYEDGEQISFDELFFVIEKISRHVRVPLSADIERGYSADQVQIVKHLERLHDIGVVGINLEDSVPGDSRVLEPLDVFCRRLAFIRNELSRKNIDLFINARTDVYLLNVPNRLQETLARMKAIENAGADGIFVPFIYNLTEIREITAATTLPVNVLSMPGLPSFDALQEAGVKRISMGGSAYRAANNCLKNVIGKIVEQGSFANL